MREREKEKEIHTSTRSHVLLAVAPRNRSKTELLVQDHSHLANLHNALLQD
jgi:hypothetical protein